MLRHMTKKIHKWKFSILKGYPAMDQKMKIKAIDTAIYLLKLIRFKILIGNTKCS